MQTPPTKKYLCIQRNDPGQLPTHPPSPDEMQKIHAAFNAERAREEAAGHIRWLRPDYQIPLFQKSKSGGAKVPLSPDLDSSDAPSTDRTPLNHDLRKTQRTVGTRSTRVPLQPSRGAISSTTPPINRAKTTTKNLPHLGDPITLTKVNNQTNLLVKNSAN